MVYEYYYKKQKKVKKIVYPGKYNSMIKWADNNRLDKEESCKKVNWLIIIIYNRREFGVSCIKDFLQIIPRKKKKKFGV